MCNSFEFKNTNITDGILNEYNSMFAFYIQDNIVNGPSDVGGKCPAPSGSYSHGSTGTTSCCCKHGCCWDNCVSEFPPKDCLKGVPGAEWKYFNYLGGYKAVRKSEFSIDLNVII